LNDAQKLKENAEKKLKEYEKIIENSKKEAKKILLESQKKLENDLDKKKQILDGEINKEIKTAENEIMSLKKSSINNINKIAIEISSELLKQTVGKELNMSSVSAVVEDISKKKIDKYL
jgi:F-type H+-transporting ATPase subunit b